MEMEDFKRPNHNDFKTSSELRKDKFNGIRHNSITDDLEFWIEGEIIVSSSLGDRKIRPTDFEEKIAEYCGMYHAQIGERK